MQRLSERKNAEKTPPYRVSQPNPADIILDVSKTERTYTKNYWVSCSEGEIFVSGSPCCWSESPEIKVRFTRDSLFAGTEDAFDAYIEETIEDYCIENGYIVQTGTYKYGGNPYYEFSEKACDIV